MYSRTQLQTITAELGDPHTTQAEKAVLVEAWTADAYKRLDHALDNQHAIPTDLANHVVEWLARRSDHHPDQAREWDRLVATALTRHAETGRLNQLPDWQQHDRHVDTPEIDYQPPQRAKTRTRRRTGGMGWAFDDCVRPMLRRWSKAVVRDRLVRPLGWDQRSEMSAPGVACARARRSAGAVRSATLFVH